MTTTKYGKCISKACKKKNCIMYVIQHKEVIYWTHGLIEEEEFLAIYKKMKELTYGTAL